MRKQLNIKDLENKKLIRPEHYGYWANVFGGLYCQQKLMKDKTIRRKKLYD